MNQKKIEPKRIGELLIEADIIKPEIFLEALRLAADAKTPIGKVLINLGILKEHDLEAALEAQQMLKDGIVSYQFALRALSLAVKKDASLSEGFRELGWHPPPKAKADPNELAQLLLAANIISRKQLDAVLSMSAVRNISLGRCLVGARIITSRTLLAGLTAQVMLRDGKLEFNQAVTILRTAHQKQATFEQAMQEKGMQSDLGIKLAELLSSIGLLTEQDAAVAIEENLGSGQLVGQIFVRQGLVSQAVLEDGLALQDFVKAHKITRQQAFEMLKDSKARNEAIKNQISQIEEKQQDLQRTLNGLNLLKAAGLADDFSSPNLEGLTVEQQVEIMDSLKTTLALDNSLISVAGRAQGLIDGNVLDDKQAIAVILHIVQTGADFEDALEATPWIPVAPATLSTPSELPQPTIADKVDIRTRFRTQEVSWLSKLWAKIKGRNG